MTCIWQVSSSNTARTLFVLADNFVVFCIPAKANIRTVPQTRAQSLCPKTFQFVLYWLFFFSTLGTIIILLSIVPIDNKVSLRKPEINKQSGHDTTSCRFVPWKSACLFQYVFLYTPIFLFYCIPSLKLWNYPLHNPIYVSLTVMWPEILSIILKINIRSFNNWWTPTYVYALFHIQNCISLKC